MSRDRALRGTEFCDALEPSQLSRLLYRTKRKVSMFQHLAFAPEAVSGLVMSVAGVSALGVVEGALLSKSRAAGRLRFALRYGVAQVLPSIIWATAPAALICRRLRLDPACLLREKSGMSSRAEGAVHWIQTVRSIIAGFVGIAHILRLVEVAGEAEREYQLNVMRGREPLVPGVSERVVRLAGSASDVTELSVRRYGDHIVPVFEDPAAIASFVEEQSRGGQRPFYWHVPSGQYSNARMWDNFGISAEWLVPVRAPRGLSRVLIVEADASVGEEALALGSSCQSNDLEVAEAGQAFAVLRRQLRELRAEGAEGVSIARVFLTNLQVPVHSGSGRATSRREALEMYNEADIILDASQPLLKAVHGWLESQPAGTRARRRVVFETKNQEYFAAMKRVLKEKQWEVADTPDWSGVKGVKKRKYFEGTRDLFIVYEQSTSDTVHQVRQLIANGLPAEQICALLDRHEGVAELESLAKELSEEVGGAADMKQGRDGELQWKVKYVCSAEIYDDLFAAVRKKIREGNSFGAIQKWVDDSNAL